MIKTEHINQAIEEISLRVIIVIMLTTILPAPILNYLLKQQDA